MSIHSRRRLPMISFLVVLAATITLAAAGLVSLWLPILWSMLPWALLIRHRFGVSVALVATVIATLFAALIGLILTAAVHVPIVLAFVVAAAAIGAVGLWMLQRRPGRPFPGTRRAVVALAPALGALVWGAALALTRLLPHSAPLSWVMNGDSANNVLFARVDLMLNGIRLGASENPVPLPAGLIAIGAAAGRSSVPSSQLLGHDLTAMALVWGAIIAVLCVLVGTVAGMTVDSSRPVVRGVAGAAASFVPLTWYVVGYPIEYGFLNTHVALVIVLAGWVAFIGLAGRPALLLGLLTLCCTLLLAVWSPLVLFPGLLILVVLARSRRTLFRETRRDRILGLVGIAQLIAYFALATLAPLFAQSGFLSAGGGAYAFSKWVLIGLAVVAFGIGAITVRVVGAKVGLGVLAMAAATVLGWGALIFLARTAPHPLISYYPLKFAWLGAVVLLVVILGSVIAIAARWTRRAATTAVAMILISVATVGVIRLAPTSSGGYAIRNPVQRILVGDFIGSGDATAARIVRYADVNAPTLLVGSNDPEESTIDFWVLQMQANSVSGKSVLRYAAYGLVDYRRPPGLCKVLAAMRVPATIVTADSGLATVLGKSCPETEVRIRLSDMG